MTQRLPALKFHVNETQSFDQRFVLMKFLRTHKTSEKYYSVDQNQDRSNIKVFKDMWNVLKIMGRRGHDTSI